MSNHIHEYYVQDHRELKLKCFIGNMKNKSENEYENEMPDCCFGLKKHIIII